MDADHFRGQFLSRIADLERGMDAVIFAFYEVDPEKELLFRSTILARMGLRAKTEAVDHVVAALDLDDAPPFSSLPRRLRKATQTRNLVAHARSANSELDRQLLRYSWAKRGKALVQDVQPEHELQRLVELDDAVAQLLGEALRVSRHRDAVLGAGDSR